VIAALFTLQGLLIHIFSAILPTMFSNIVFVADFTNLECTVSMSKKSLNKVTCGFTACAAEFKKKREMSKNDTFFHFCHSLKMAF
jgi:hypothetical protein